MRVLLLGVYIVCAAGCDPETPESMLPIEPARYDPDRMAGDAMRLHDTNRDGAIGGAEFRACTALKMLNNGSGVTRADLKARFAAYAASPVSVVPVSVLVRKDGSPAASVTCTLTPEPFMGPGFKPASCQTDSSGFGEFRVDGAGGVGVPAGFYRLAISMKAADGRERLPAALNSTSTDVREISGDGRTAQMAMQIDLPARFAAGR
jgi:hypothetical protein